LNPLFITHFNNDGILHIAERRAGELQHMTEAKHIFDNRSGLLTEISSLREGRTILRGINAFKLRLESTPGFQRICNALVNFGLSKNEAKVFIYLAKYGEQKAHKISKALSLHRTETYKILKRLEEKGLVYRILDKPIKFAVIPIGEALENLVREEKQKIQQLEEEKRRILEMWDSIMVPIKNHEALGEFIQVLKGKNQICIKASELIRDAEEEILMVASGDILLQLFYSGVMDDLAERAEKVKMKVITDSSLKSKYILKKLDLKDKSLSIDIDNMPSFILSEKNLILFIAGAEKNERRAIWTNQKAMIDALRVSFLTLNGTERKY